MVLDITRSGIRMKLVHAPNQYTDGDNSAIPIFVVQY